MNLLERLFVRCCPNIVELDFGGRVRELEAVQRQLLNALGYEAVRITSAPSYTTVRKISPKGKGSK